MRWLLEDTASHRNDQYTYNQRGIEYMYMICNRWNEHWLNLILEQDLLFWRKLRPFHHPKKGCSIAESASLPLDESYVRVFTHIYVCIWIRHIDKYFRFRTFRRSCKTFFLGGESSSEKDLLGINSYLNFCTQLITTQNHLNHYSKPTK